MRPFQLWLPVVERSSREAAADKERAFAAWQRESCVWLLPSVEEPQRWQAGKHWWSWHLAVPGFPSNRVDIFHITKDGEAVGPEAKTRFPRGCVEGLLEAWLNLDLAPIGDRSRESPQPFRLLKPWFDCPEVTYEEELFGYIGPSDAELAEYLDADPACWEERSTERSSHSLGSTGHKHNDAENEVPQSPQAILQCPQRLATLPYSRLFFEDIIVAQEQMAGIAQKCREDRRGALWEAREAAMLYVTQGLITRGSHWLWSMGPTLWKTARGDDSKAFRLLFENAHQEFGINAREIKTAMRSGEWPGTMGQLILIRRAWGIIGLFWALFLERLENNQLQRCLLCDQLIPGKKGKKFCGPADNKVCFRQRRANHQRTSRANRK
jgi:hypothetical protein